MPPSGRVGITCNTKVHSKYGVGAKQSYQSYRKGYFLNINKAKYFVTKFDILNIIENKLLHIYLILTGNIAGWTGEGRIV